jgi:hypothetical protein
MYHYVKLTVFPSSLLKSPQKDSSLSITLGTFGLITQSPRIAIPLIVPSSYDPLHFVPYFKYTFTRLDHFKASSRVISAMYYEYKGTVS